MDTGKHRILFIDEDRRDVQLIHDTLPDAHRIFDFIPAPGIDAAIERLCSEEFDVVLLDLGRASDTGEEIIKNVLAHGDTIPIVVLIDIQGEPLRMRALQLGVWDCLVKDRLDRDTLLRSLTAAVEHRMTERALTASEARYRRLLESVTDYVYMVQIEDGRHTASWHSPSCAAVTGYTSEEYARDPFLWYRMVHEDDRQAVLDMANKVFAGKAPPPLEHRIIHKDGSIRWIKNTPVPRCDREGHLIAYDGLVSDITARKQAERELLRVNKALRESEERLKRELDNRTRAKKEWEATFDAISNPLFIHDREFRIMRANRAYCESACMTFQELIGKPYYAVFPKMNAPFKSREEATSRGETKLFPDEEITIPSLHKIFRVRSHPVHDDDGRYLCSVHILEDITEMKLAEKNIKQEVELTANLLTIAEAAAYTMDIDKLMELTARCGSRVLGCDACVSYLWDGDRKVFQPGAHHGLDHELIPLFRTESLDDNMGFVKRILDLKRPLLVRFPEVDGVDGRASAVASPLTGAGEACDTPLPTKTPAWMNSGMKTLIVIPLVGKTDDLGLIITGYRADKTFLERDHKIVEGLSRQISLALDEAQLYRTAMEQSLELNHKIETLQVIHEIDRSILSSLEPHEILETTTRNISRVVPCDRAGILLVDRDRQGFIQATGNGTPASTNKPFVPFHETSATDVIKTSRPQYAGNQDGLKTILPNERRLIEEGFVSHIRVPLIVKGDPVGVLGVDSRRAAAFTPENLSTLEKLAALIGVALENTRLVSDLKELLLGTVKSLSNAIDAKSPWTAGHSERVTYYALQIGEKMSLQDGDLKDLELGGLLHDVGKIGIYDAILNKPASLTREEYEVVKGHPLRGVGLLEPIKQLNRIIPCIRHHHERIDGSGYPDGLKGESIPLWARILAVADAFDSMTSDRPYRKAFGREEAVDELKRCSKTQFDPEIVKAFINTLEGNKAPDQRQSSPPRAALVN
jgi:PAS domain S-box-containing protein